MDDLKSLVKKVITYAREQKADLRYKNPKKVVPRKYQKECTNCFVEHLLENDYAFGVLATGTGKTLIARLVAELLLNNKTKGLYIAHMPTLLTQFQKEFRINSEFFPVKYDDPDPTSLLQMQTIQSLLNLKKRNPSAYRKHIRRYKYIFFDEVHHYSISQLKKWNTIAEDLLRNGCKFICLTATLNRHDGAPILTKNYEDHIVYNYGIQEGVHDCYLSEVYGLAVQTKIEPDSCAWDGTDLNLTFSDAKFSERTKVIAKTLKYVNEYRERRCQTIIFVRRVAEAHRLAEELGKYKNLGKIVAIDGKTRQTIRQEIFEQFENKKVNILINVGTLVEGVNLPSCDTVAMCRSTKSRGFYQQMLGRGTRVCEGKDFLLVIDFVDNISNHHFGGIQTCASLLDLEENELVTGPIFTQRRGTSKANQEARIVETFYENVSLYRKFLPFEEARDLIQRMPVMRDAETGELDIEATRKLHVKLNGTW